MTENGETPEHILQILRARLSYFKSATTPVVQYNDSTSVFRIEVPDIYDFNTELLLSYGQIDICETYDIQRIKNPKLDSLISIYPDFASYGSMSDDACLLIAKERYMNTIDNLLEANRSSLGFPYDLRLCWSWTPVDNVSGNRYKSGNSFYSLYIIKDSHQNLNLSESHADSKITKGFGGVEISLNDLGATKFAQLTQHNIGRPLAMVTEDKVFSAPRVTSRIEGGKLQISSGSDMEFAEGLLALLNTERLKSKAEIISVDRKRVEKGGF